MYRKILRNYDYKIFIILILLFLLAGCNLIAQPSTSVEYTSLFPTAKSSSTVSLSLTLPGVLTKTTTTTPTPTQTRIVLPTLTSSVDPTWTPLATLSTDRAIAKVKNLLEDNAGCELPCWWGITPGKTSWEEAKQFLSSLSTEIDIGESYIVNNNIEHYTAENNRVYFNLSRSPAKLNMVYRIVDGVTDHIEINLHEYLVRYEFLLFIDLFGKPDDILINVTPDTPAGTPYFALALFYPAKGILAIYEGSASRKGDSVNVCTKGSSLSLYLWPEDILTLEKMKISYWDYQTRSMFSSLDKIMGIDVATFYQLVKQKRGCFEVKNVY